MTASADGISLGGMAFQEADRHAQRCIDGLAKALGWSATITGYSARPDLFVFEAELLDARHEATARAIVRVDPRSGATLKLSKMGDGLAVLT